MFKRILVPTDGSEGSLRAARLAAELAEPLQAELVGFHTIPPFHVLDFRPGQLEESQQSYTVYAEKRAATVLGDWRAAAEAAGARATTVFAYADDPYAAIIAAAEEQGCDLVVMASHGRRGMAALMLGSVTQKVLTHSTIPVLVVR
ncbi:universal stress protein [Tahibacter caeni]|uniref:universal stress protein n=1 Tax=Tahibacter caeni TaxID=1453545 RepID=UPI002147351C|nr:universal stress protein [Tahibacter caeni]